MPRKIPMSPEGRRLRGLAAALGRHHPDDPARAAVVRRALKVDGLKQHIRQARDTDPPLTDEDWADVAALLPEGAA